MEYTVLCLLGIQIWKIDRKNNEMAIEFEIDVKFGWFFVKKGFNFNASFDHPRGSKFYLLNLFFEVELPL